MQEYTFLLKLPWQSTQVFFRPMVFDRFVEVPRSADLYLTSLTSRDQETAFCPHVDIRCTMRSVVSAHVW